MRTDERHVVAGIKFIDRFAATAHFDPCLILQRGVIATHCIGHKLERFVLASLITAVGHITVENAVDRGVKGFRRRHNGGRVEHFDVQLAAGHDRNRIYKVLNCLTIGR